MTIPQDQKAAALKACPFCGGKAYVSSFYPDDISVHCQSCQAQTISRNNETAAISAWNTRLSPDTVTIKRVTVEEFASVLQTGWKCNDTCDQEAEWLMGKYPHGLIIVKDRA